MSETRFQMPGGWQESFWAQQTPSEAKSLSRFTNYRISNINAAFEKSSLEIGLRAALHLSEHEELQIWSLTPDLIYPEKKVATVSLKGDTNFLGAGKTERHLFLDYEVDSSVREPVVMDTHFLGFTPLNNPCDGGDHKFEYEPFDFTSIA
jgi:hypothetical protein